VTGNIVIYEITQATFLKILCTFYISIYIYRLGVGTGEIKGSLKANHKILYWITCSKQTEELLFTGLVLSSSLSPSSIVRDTGLCLLGQH